MLKYVNALTLLCIGMSCTVVVVVNCNLRFPIWENLGTFP